MKKFLKLLLLSVIIISFVACGNGKDSKNNGKKSNNNTSNKTEEVSRESDSDNTSKENNENPAETDEVTPSTGETDSNSPNSEDLSSDKETTGSESKTRLPDSAVSGVFGRMPSSISVFAYASLDEVRKSPNLDKYVEDFSEYETMKPIIDMIDSAYIGISSVDKEMLEKVEGGESDGDEDYVAILRGNFNQESIRSIMLEENKDEEEKPAITDVQGFEVITFDGSSYIYLNESTVIITKQNFETTAIEAYVDGKDTVDLSSPGYNVALNMNSNVMWLASDFSDLGEVDLGEETGNMMQGKTKLGVTKMGVSLENDIISFDMSAELDSDKVAQSVAMSVNGFLVFGKGFVTGQLPQLGMEEKTQEELTNLINGIQFGTKDKCVTLNVSIRESLLEELLPLMKAME